MLGYAESHRSLSYDSGRHSIDLFCLWTVDKEHVDLIPIAGLLERESVCTARSEFDSPIDNSSGLALCFEELFPVVKNQVVSLIVSEWNGH